MLCISYEDQTGYGREQSEDCEGDCNEKDGHDDVQYDENDGML